MKPRSEGARRPYIPYGARRKRSITIRIDELTLAYFKKMGNDSGLPYQMLINLFLRDCTIERRRLSMKWKRGDFGID